MENVPGAFEVVLEAMSGQDSSRQALDIENPEKHMENLGFLASHRSVLEASWSVLEAWIRWTRGAVAETQGPLLGRIPEGLEY